MNFENKRVVLTGGASGIGKAAFERFLRLGAYVCVVDVNGDTLNALKDEFPSDRLLTIKTDISSEESCNAMVATIKKEWSTVDILINNAGWFPTTEFEQITLADWQKVMSINLDGPFLMVKSLLDLIKQSKNGRIINMASGSYFNPPTNQAHYVAAKAGIIGFTRALSRSLGKYNITVNVITPGITVTEAVERLFDRKILDALAAMGSIVRDETPNDLVGTMLFLASEDANFITGQTINVDGGRSFV